MPDLSQRDLDLITRTVIGEAGDEPELGKAAVAHVIFNRMKQKNANDAASIVLAPKQFTTWQDRPAELARISPRSKAYQDAYDIVQNAAGGDIPDPTNGALNYANVDTRPQGRQHFGDEVDQWNGQCLQNRVSYIWKR